MTAVAGPRINSFLQRLLVQASHGGRPPRVQEFYPPRTYHQTQSDGKIFVRPLVKQKNGFWTCLETSSHQPRKVKLAKGVDPVHLSWEQTPDDQIPPALKSAPVPPALAEAYKAAVAEASKFLVHSQTKTEAAIQVVADTYTKAEQKQIANTIMQQLGGNKFIAMTGAKQMTFGEDKGRPFVQFSIGRNAEYINKVKVALTPADEYDVFFYTNKHAMFLLKKKVDGIYADQLQEVFTRYTGLATSLGGAGRPVPKPDALEGIGHNSAGGERVHPAPAPRGATADQAKIAKALADYGKTYREYLIHIKAAAPDMGMAVRFGAQDLYNRVKGQKPDQIVDSINQEIEDLKKAMEKKAEAPAPAADPAPAAAAPEKPKRGRPAAAPAAERHAQMKGGKAGAPAPADMSPAEAESEITRALGGRAFFQAARAKNLQSAASPEGPFIQFDFQKSKKLWASKYAWNRARVFRVADAHKKHGLTYNVPEGEVRYNLELYSVGRDGKPVDFIKGTHTALKAEDLARVFQTQTGLDVPVSHAGGKPDSQGRSISEPKLAEPKAEDKSGGKTAWVESAKIGGHMLHILYKKSAGGGSEVVHGFSKKEDAEREAAKLNGKAAAPAPKAPAKPPGPKAPAPKAEAPTKKTAGPKPPGPPSASKAPAPTPKPAPKAPAKADAVPAEIKALAKKISGLTDNNDHTEAALTLAKFLKHPRATKDLTETQKVQRQRGHMPANLRDNRDSVIVPTLLKLAAKRFGEAAGKLLHGAF